MHPAASPAHDDLVRGRRMLGEFELIFCTDGSFLLDGGAMFGVVPKTLWSRRTPADEQNRVLLGTNCVVVRTGKAVVLLETGIGNKQTAKMRSILANGERLPASLAAAGVARSEITHVINTHLHFDHCGWNTTLDADGSITPTFPDARYFCAAGELAHGRLQLERDRVSYLAANYDPLIAAGQLTVIDPNGEGGYTPDDVRLRAPDSSGPPLPPVPVQRSLEIVPGICVEPFPGHTANMLAVHIEPPVHARTTEHACYIGDLIPTHHHLDPTWVMGYDLDPLRCIAERKRFLARAIPERWLVLFTHDHALPFTYLEQDERGKPVVSGIPRFLRLRTDIQARMSDVFSHFDLATMPKGDAYKLLASTIMPRPIAWIVSRDQDDALNAAPFSFFNIVSADPPLIAVSFSGTSDRDVKDTLHNIRQHGEFVVNLVSEELAEAMNVTATNAPRGTDETQLAGLELAPSAVVKVPRIAASPVALECTLFETITPGATSTICLARIVYVHVRTAAFRDLERLYVDPAELRLIGRMHGSGGYCTTRDLFTLERKNWPLA